MESLIKNSAETKTVQIDFSSDLRTGETINDANITVSAENVLTGVSTTGSIISGDATSSSGVISFKVTGGADGESHKITISTGATDGLTNTYVESIIMSIEDNYELLYTLNELKTQLGITGTSRDAILLGILKSASEYIEKITRRAFFVKEYTETIYEEDPQDCLLLSNFPVLSIESVVIAGETLSASTGGLANYRSTDDGALFRIDGGCFASEPYTNVVTYKAGHLRVPEDVRNAVKIIAAGEYGRRQKEGILSESVGSYTIKFDNDTPSHMNKIVQDIAARYKKRVF